MEKDIFVYNEKYNNYNAIIDNIKFSISHRPTDTELKYIKSISAEYEKNIIKIAEYLLSDRSFKQFFNCNNITNAELIENLDIPTIRILKENNAEISYCNHKLDKQHIISFEVLGVFQKLDYLSIDG